MKALISALAICLAISLMSCGGGDEDCSGDYVGSWTGSINCSGSSEDEIDVDITQISGDTLSIISNGERMTGVLNGCDLQLIPQEFELSIFGTLTISGSLEIIGDELAFTQNRSAGGTDEVCTFVGKQ